FEPKIAELKELVSLPASARKAVLLIQPPGSVGISIQNMFESFGLRVRLVHDIEKARVILESPQQVVQLLLLDADYLGQSVVSFVPEFFRSWPEANVVVTTVNRNHWERELQQMSQCLVVEKPLSMRMLQGLLRDLYHEDWEASTGHGEPTSLRLTSGIERVAPVSSGEPERNGSNHVQEKSHERRGNGTSERRRGGGGA
ncbi:MAG: hypothetical protein KDD60_03845, partial [Bdellovibrionales bacterium]|nr:hypothetical protein [Bdellovibrionales bacterium]